MFGNNEFVGITLEEDYIKYAHIKKEGDGIRLLKVDRVSLAEKIQREDTGSDQEISEEEDEDSIFGIDDEEETGDEIDEDLMEEAEDEDLMDLSVEEGEEMGRTNSGILSDVFTQLNDNRVDLGINIPAGETIIQVLRDTDYEEVKQKELRSIIEDKLESIYGTPKSEEFYAYEIRDDGALILASVEQYAPALQIVDEAKDLYDGKVFVKDVMPDESALVGLTRANYKLEETEVTALIQFEQKHCRIVFMKGGQLWLVSPIINEGTNSDTLLNTIFSKLLYQLDTGEVPSLDRILLINNTIGDRAVEFFNNNFPDISVGNFEFSSERFDPGDFDPAVVNGFTTSIALAWGVSGMDDDIYPELTFLPKYVVERQKVFKLQWHGILLLMLIGLSPIVLNYFYQSNVEQINRLENQINSTEQQINEVQQTVEAVNKLESDFGRIQQNLTMVDTLVANSQKWTTTLQMVNERVQSVNSLWINSLNTVGSGLRIEGMSLYRNRITQFVDVFDEAILDQVNLTTVRDEEIYQFTVSVRSIVENQTEFAPEQNREIQQLLGGQ